MPHASEMATAWLRCTAVALDDTQRVRVRYQGYTAADDEWRPLSDLRPHCPRVPPGWRAKPRRVGEEVEVSWAPQGHPTCMWEAEVRAVEQKRCQVRFKGFGADWDEWVLRTSTRLRNTGAVFVWPEG